MTLSQRLSQDPFLSSLQSQEYLLLNRRGSDDTFAIDMKRQIAGKDQQLEIKSKENEGRKMRKNTPLPATRHQSHGHGVEYQCEVLRHVRTKDMSTLRYLFTVGGGAPCPLAQRHNLVAICHAHIVLVHGLVDNMAHSVVAFKGEMPRAWRGQRTLHHAQRVPLGRRNVLNLQRVVLRRGSCACVKPRRVERSKTGCARKRGRVCCPAEE